MPTGIAENAERRQRAFATSPAPPASRGRGPRGRPPRPRTRRAACGRACGRRDRQLEADRRLGHLLPARVPRVGEPARRIQIHVHAVDTRRPPGHAHAQSLPPAAHAHVGPPLLDPIGVARAPPFAQPSRIGERAVDALWWGIDPDFANDGVALDADVRRSLRHEPSSSFRVRVLRRSARSSASTYSFKPSRLRSQRQRYPASQWSTARSGCGLKA